MRIAIIATGSRGDVQPYIALGKGLHEAGHSIRVVTHQNFESLVASHGLEFWPVAGDVQEIVQTPEMRQRIEGGNFIRLKSQMAKEAQIGAVHLAKASSAGVTLAARRRCLPTVGLIAAGLVAISAATGKIR